MEIRGFLAVIGFDAVSAVVIYLEGEDFLVESILLNSLAHIKAAAAASTTSELRPFVDGVGVGAWVHLVASCNWRFHSVRRLSPWLNGANIIVEVFSFFEIFFVNLIRWFHHSKLTLFLIFGW